MRNEIEFLTKLWRIGDVIDLVEGGLLGLPDFQRRFEWTTTDVCAFLSTALSGLPSGSLLLAHNADLGVSLRPLEGAPHLNDRPDQQMLVLLDGQQRVTALYHAVTGLGAYRYGLDMSALLDGADLLDDEVVVSSPASRWDTLVDHASRDDRLIAPMTALLTPNHFFTWLQQTSLGTDPSVRDRLGEIFATSLTPLVEYRMPGLELRGGIELPVVAQVFERLNKWGQPLSSFDLLVARLQGAGWNLREAWAQLCDQDADVLRVFGTQGLLAIAGLALHERGDVRRSAVLSLQPTLVAARWDEVSAATAWAANVLRSCGVADSSLLPYDSIAVAMVAVGLSRGQMSRELLEGYFWMASLSSRYDSASNTKVTADYRQLLEGIPIYTDWSWLPEAQVLSTRTRRSSRALWSALLCAVVTNEPLDLLSGDKVTGTSGWYPDFELIPIARGGGGDETVKEIPTRLRALGQHLCLSQSKVEARRVGFSGIVRFRWGHPTIFGPTIDEVSPVNSSQVLRQFLKENFGRTTSLSYEPQRSGLMWPTECNRA